jgi:multicomponent Na+:H+ antiporter subunit E
VNAFALNLILALAWAAIAGGFTLGGLATGFLLGYAALWLLAPLTGTGDRYPLRLIMWVRLLAMFLYELVVSSLSVAWDVLTPTHLARPAIIEVPLDVRTEAGLLLVTNLISLTPGTLSVDVSEDRRTLYVHAMFADDPDKLRHDLKNGMERWVMEAVE